MVMPRYSELHRKADSVTYQTRSTTLKELSADGLIHHLPTRIPADPT